MKVFLKIDDDYKELDLYASERISTTFTFDSLLNPTDIVSDYSEQFSVPRSQRNNRIFGEYYRLDALSSSYINTIPVHCIITNNVNSPLLEGSAYITHITSTDYKLQINGSLFTIFGKIGEIDYNEPLEYHRVSGQLVKTGIPNVITKSNVAYSWLTSNRPIIQTIPVGVTQTDVYLNDWIGWGMTYGDEYEDFDSNKWLTRLIFTRPYGTGLYESSVGQITNNLQDGYMFLEGDDGGNRHLYAKSNIYVYEDNALELTGTETNMSEFRSYYQCPYLKLKKWFDYTGDEIERLMGYECDFSVIDDEAIYVLPRFYDGEKSKDIEVEDFTGHIDVSRDQCDGDYFSDDMPQGTVDMLPEVTGYFDEMLLNPNEIDESVFHFRIGLTTPLNPYGRDFEPYWDGHANPILVDIDNGVTSPRKVAVILVPDWFKLENSYNKYVDYYGVLGYELQYVYYHKFNWIEFDIASKIGGCDDGYKENVMSYQYQVKVTVANFEKPYYDNVTGLPIDVSPIALGLNKLTLTRTIKESYRTGKVINIDNLLKGQNMLDILIGYTKLNHLLWIVDNKEKTIKLHKCDDYLFDKFYNDGVLNLDKNLDFSTLEQYPISWEKEVVLMRHSLPEVAGKYDEYIIQNPPKIYEDTGELNIFDEVNTCVLAQKTENVFTHVLQDNVKKCPYILPITEEGFYNFYAFENWTNKNQHIFAGSKRARTIYSEYDTNMFYITDDSYLERCLNTFCWHSEYIMSNSHHYQLQDRTNRITYFTRPNVPATIAVFYREAPMRINVRPFLTDYNTKGFSLLYGEPVGYLYDTDGNERLNYVSDVYNGYVSEIYDTKNRKIEVTAKLNDNEWLKINRNPLVKYDHTLWLVGKVDYYNDNDQLCKIEMRRIEDIENITGRIRNKLVSIEGDENGYFNTDISGYYAPGETIQLHCLPNEGFEFAGWYIGDELISSDADFDYEVTDNVTIEGKTKAEERNTFNLDVENPNCLIISEWTSGTYEKGEEITMRAYALDGYAWMYWLDVDTEEIFSTNRQITFTMNRDYHLRTITQPINEDV